MIFQEKEKYVNILDKMNAYELSLLYFSKMIIRFISLLIFHLQIVGIYFMAYFKFYDDAYSFELEIFTFLKQFFF